MKYDKFYTKTEIAERCYTSLKSLLKDRTYLFLEPSAGSGNILDVLKANNESFYACDILPESKDIETKDFLNDELSLTGNVIAFGNPPFGKKGKTAIEFINKAFEYSQVVAFILPLQFRKYSVQSHIREDACLIYDEELPENSFTDNGKDYSLRCCFQVWCLSDTFVKEYKNLRTQKPTIFHSDFTMYQYNNSQDALKYFDYEWDFCVPRQGFVDYTQKYYSKKELSTKQQYIFFKASSKSVLDRLLKLDFQRLSKKNTLIPGFGKADVIEEYNKLYDTSIEKFM